MIPSEKRKDRKKTPEGRLVAGVITPSYSFCPYRINNIYISQIVYFIFHNFSSLFFVGEQYPRGWPHIRPNPRPGPTIGYTGGGPALRAIGKSRYQNIGRYQLPFFSPLSIFLSVTC